MIFHVLAVIGKFERELITERVNEGRIRAMAAGVKFGRKPKLSKMEEESFKCPITMEFQITFGFMKSTQLSNRVLFKAADSRSADHL